MGAKPGDSLENHLLTHKQHIACLIWPELGSNPHQRFRASALNCSATELVYTFSGKYQDSLPQHPTNELMHSCPRPQMYRQCYSVSLRRHYLLVSLPNYFKLNLECEHLVYTVLFVDSICNKGRKHLGQFMRKRVICHMRTTKVQMSLRIRAV